MSIALVAVGRAGIGIRGIRVGILAVVAVVATVVFLGAGTKLEKHNNLLRSVPTTSARW